MKRIITIQDISCLGKCSLTVALPILSAMGVEACVVPTAVLSTHTMFSGYTFRDLTEDLPPIADHWEKEGFRFDANQEQGFGYGEWAVRTGLGALYNWATVNSLLPTNRTASVFA